MQPSDTSRHNAATRRSARLAGGDSIPLQCMQAVSQSKPRKVSLAPPHQPPIPARPSLGFKVHGKANTASSRSKTFSPLAVHSSQTSVETTNKENVAPQLCDRIKQNPREATKKALSNAAKSKANAKSQHVHCAESAMEVASSQTELETQQALPYCPAVDSTSAVPASITSDPYLPKPELNNAPSTASPQRDFAPPGKDLTEQCDQTPRLDCASKRDREPNCESQPPPKRNHLIHNQLRRELDQIGAEDVPEHPVIITAPLKPTKHEVSASPRASHLLQSDETYQSTPTTGDSDERPSKSPLPTNQSKCRPKQDDVFIQNMLTALSRQAKHKTSNVGKRQARRILNLVQRAKPPSTSEAFFGTEVEATAHLLTGQFFPGPIVTRNEQSLPLQTIDEFLNEMYDDDTKVHIQDAGIRLTANLQHTREITVGVLKKYFQKGRISTPINCLELAAHVEDGIRPAFLNTEDCRLLTKLKHPGSDDLASRRRYEPGWKEVEKWALLAKAGALTEPHQDSHGYSTYITVNQGIIGFGWLSNPTDEQRGAWRKDPVAFIDGPWRYIVLREGQTVYFPAGTVHFVFRHPNEGDTLAFGGHVLRCSQIVQWVKTLLEERETRSQVTNEDLSVSAPEYLKRVEKFVRQARRNGTEWRWGGEEAIEEFLRLKAEFLADENDDEA